MVRFIFLTVFFVLKTFGRKPLSFFFIEVKRKGNYGNNNLEDDIVKLYASTLRKLFIIR
ncbi:hypothetical protein BD770DRAFT_132952 [Pilaira anomala]|nr:hypothetical protein BD770DRAFT_132952 [Pilaira anomala]